MNQLSSFRQSWWKGARLLATGAAICALTLASMSAAEPKPDKEVKADKKADKKAEKKTQYSGADLFAMHCNRCHPERYATERNAAQWNTILIHMRVRANLPADQAKAILKFLQEDSGR